MWLLFILVGKCKPCISGPTTGDQEALQIFKCETMLSPGSNSNEGEI